MKAMRLGDSGTLVREVVADPKPGPGEILIEVRAAGVIPTELQWDPTTHTKTGALRPHAVPCHEFSGVIAGSSEEVYGMNDWYADGALADFLITVPGSIAPKPRSLTHVEAAAVPISALTAWQALCEHAKLQGGERVLIHGGGGAVGLFGVQLARMYGGYVIATAAAEDRELLLELGAKEVIDYHSQRFEEIARDIDVVFDTVGGETLQRSWAVLRPSGRLVTIVSDLKGTTDERVKKAFFIVEPNRQQLIDIGEMIDAGRLKVFVRSVLPFKDAAAAYEKGSGMKQTPGKVVVTLD